MKKIFSLLITLCSLAAFGQYPVSSISITVPPNPAANTGDWAMPFVITAQAKLVQGQVPGNLMESRILVTIKDALVKKCGSFTQQTAPMSNFNTATKSWSGSAGVGLLGNGCTLKPGTYELCVQFFSSYAPVVPLSNEVCKTFTIADNKQITYSHPQNLVPAANKNFTKQEIKQPILFRWTQVTPPPPNNDVLYTVHVYAVEKGQSPAQAVKTNTTVFEKQVNTTQTIWQVPLEFTSSNETQTFVWNVQATDKKGKPYGADQGISEPTVVYIKGDEGAVKNPNDTTNSAPPNKFIPPVNLTPPDGKILTKQEADQSVLLKWTPVTPTPKGGVLYKVRVVELKIGQTAAQAIRTNTVLFEKEVTNQTQLLSGNDVVVIWPIASDSKYAWNVQAYINGKLIGESEATSITFKKSDEDAKLKERNDTTDSAPPINILPINGKNFTQKEARQPIALKWKHRRVDTMGNDYIMYTVHVYVVEKGQTSSQAIKNNKPVFEKQVNTKETIWQMPVEYTNAKETKTFVWNVRATDKAGKAVGRNNGTSESTVFRTSDCDVYLSLKLDSVICLPGTNGNNRYRVCITSTYTSSTYNLTYNDATSGLKAYHPSYTPTYAITNLSPALQVQNSGPTTSVAYCFEVTIPIGQNTIKIGLQGDDKDPGPIVCQPGAEIDVTLPSCICNDCEKAKINFNNITTTATGSNGDQYNIAGNISVTGLAVFGLEFQMQSFTYTATPAACSNGVTDIEQSGMFLIPATTINGSSAIQVFNETVSPSGTNNNASKDVKLVSTTPMSGNIPVNLLIGLPGPLTGLDPKCCKMKYTVCIRVTVYYEKDSCKSCVFTHCFNFSN